jgi:hydroxymethylbilane synthase
MRGNVETRIRKVTDGQVDAIVVACAGLNRLGLAKKISVVLPPTEFIPAPAQGALAVQIRSDDSELAELLTQIDDKNSRTTAETERCVLEAVHGGCSIPLGVYSQINKNTITIDAIICDLNGKKYIRCSTTSPLNKAKTSAKNLAKQLLDDGANEILTQIRNS